MASSSKPLPPSGEIPIPKMRSMKSIGYSVTYPEKAGIQGLSGPS
jgi:hypothetical protein